MAELDNFVLIDVRNHNEFRARRLEGAILIPYTQVAARAVNEIYPKDIVVLVYCQGGRRSAIAARTLIGLGFSNIYDFGGINDWHFDTISG